MKEKTPTNLLNFSDYLPCQMKLGSSQDIVVVLQKKNLQKQIMAKKYDFTFFGVCFYVYDLFYRRAFG